MRSPLPNKPQDCSNQTNEEPFIDLSKVDPPDVCTEPGENAEPGYYGHPVEHPPSYPVKLSDQDSMPATGELWRIENPSIVKNSQPKSLQLYYSKLADYKETARDVDPIQFYKQTTGRTGAWQEDDKEYELDQFVFRLDLSDDLDREVISESRRFNRLPNVKQLWIYNIQKEKDSNVQEFLLNVVPETLKQFMFGGTCDNGLNVSFYLEGLHEALKSTSRRVHFTNCMFSSSDLQSIFIASKHIEKLVFESCKLDVTDQFDIIEEEKFHIEELLLSYCGDKSDWKNDIAGLEMLVKAVADSHLKHSLKKIEILEKDMDSEFVDKVKMIFEKHELIDILKLNE